MSATANLREARVIYPPYYFYSSYLDKFKRCIQPSTKWQVDDYSFKDGTPCVQVMIGQESPVNELKQMPRHQAIIPIWLSTQFNLSLPEMVWGVGSVVNALKRTDVDEFTGESRPALVDRIVALCPYLELRMDKDSGRNGIKYVGEPNIPQMYGKFLGGKDGIDDMVLFGAHSYEAVKGLREGGINVVPVTSAPLFADFIKSNLFIPAISDNIIIASGEDTRIDPKNTQVIALDKGSLQQNIYLTELLGLNPFESLVAFDKSRKGENVVEKSSLIYGSLEDLEGRDVILYDDIIDTFGSMEITVNTLKNKCKCKSITVVSTHSVLSHPARRNIIHSVLKNKTVDRVITSDSLPKAKFLFEDSEDFFHVVESAGLLSSITQKLAESSYEKVMTDPETKSYILDPMDKEKVWADFKAQADPLKIHDICAIK